MYNFGLTKPDVPKALIYKAMCELDRYIAIPGCWISLRKI